MTVWIRNEIASWGSFVDICVLSDQILQQKGALFSFFYTVFKTEQMNSCFFKTNLKKDLLELFCQQPPIRQPQKAPFYRQENKAHPSCKAANFMEYIDEAL